MQDLSPSGRMMDLIKGYLVSQALYVTATLGIADLLRDRPQSAKTLAVATGTKAEPLYRLLRALAAIGVFHEDSERNFTLTDMGECLRTDSPEPVGGYAAYIGRPYSWVAAGDLLHTIRTGESAFRHVHGTDSWSYRAQHPDEEAIFDRAMTDISRLTAAGVVAAYAFGRFERIIDVGGGNGALLTAILAANPAVRGVLFDQKEVVGRARPLLEAAGVADRCECIGGSFFESVPAGGDAYVMKSILHDWDTDEAIAILRVCRAAMAPGAKLLAIDHVIGPPNERPVGKFTDINMLIQHGARERTEHEFAALYAAADFKLTRIVPATRDFCVIEGKPV
jgi:hypothetical protein